MHSFNEEFGKHFFDTLIGYSTRPSSSNLPLPFRKHNLEDTLDMAEAAATNNLASRFGVTGRNYIVTGGAQGIGFATVKAIAEAGGNVVAVDIKENPSPELLKLADTFRVKVKYIQADVTKEPSLKAAFQGAIDLLGGIDGCVTCAGIAIEKPFEEHTFDEVRNILDINVSHILHASSTCS
jgi:NADPH:quinone reductase-like Zn-dependent oxidoreductase